MLRVGDEYTLTPRGEASHEGKPEYEAVMITPAFSRSHRPS